MIKSTPWLRGIVVWVLLMAVESVHGALRQRFLAPLVGDFEARRIAVLTGAALIFVVTALAIRWVGIRDRAGLLGLGAWWVALTVLFEVALGRWVFGFGWSRILQDFDLRNGGLMGIGLAAMLFTPLLAARMRGVRLAVLALCVPGIACAAWEAAIASSIWRIRAPEGVVRWIEIHDLAEGNSTGIYHVQVLERRSGSRPWQFRSLAAHMALTESALRASIMGAGSERSVYPETYESGLQAWKDRAATGKAPLCRSEVTQCL